MNNWFRKLATVQEWSVVARGCVPAVIVLLLFLQHFVWSLQLLSLPDRDHYIDAAFLSAVLPVVGGLTVGAAALLALGLWLRRRRPDAVWFQHLAANYYGLSLSGIGYLDGGLSFVVGVAMMGAPLVGFVLLERRVVPVAFAVSFLTILGYNLAAAFGAIPYGPMLRVPTDVASALVWTNRQFLMAAPHLLVNTTLLAIMIGRWREREAGILALSMTDPLTAVHNRRSILALVEKEAARTRRYGPPMAVVVLDLDHFKRINDTWGHPVGDRVIQAAARVLVETARLSDAVGRFGGEEFLVLLPDTSRAGALRLVERCREQLAALAITADNGERVPVSASFGVACNEGCLNASAELLIRRADEALYQAKLRGRNRVVAADPLLESEGEPAGNETESSRERYGDFLPTLRWGPRTPPSAPLAGRMDVLRQFIAGVLEWSQMAKTGLVMGLMVALYSGLLTWLLIVLRSPDASGLIDPAYGRRLVPVMLATIGLAIVLMMSAFLLHVRRHRAVWLQWVALHFFSLMLVATGHVLGMLSMPTGLMLTGMPMLGFILFRRDLVLSSFVLGVLGVVASSYMTALGWTPYAPLLTTGDHPPYMLCTPFWMASNYLFVALTVSLVFLLSDQILGRWREREAFIHGLSLTDALTAIHNRRSILALLDKELARTRRHGPPVGLVVLDLDHFKQINDRWGHATGDRVLRLAASLLQASIRQCDAVGRFGGEEFLLLLPDTTSEGAATLAMRCRERLEALDVLADNGERVPVTASFGVVCNELEPALDAEAMIRMADHALYRAKAGGRNRVQAALA